MEINETAREMGSYNNRIKVGKKQVYVVSRKPLVFKTKNRNTDNLKTGQ